jgi:hypothetical protein
MSGVVTVLLTVAVFAACTQRDCPNEGYNPTIEIDVSQVLSDRRKAVRAEVCVEETCNAVRRLSGRLPDVVSGDDPTIDRVGPVHVSLSIEDRSGDVIFHDEAVVELTRRQPNGPDCPPTLYSAFMIAEPRTASDPITSRGSLRAVQDATPIGT